jgi:hypothetical protein
LGWRSGWGALDLNAIDPYPYVWWRVGPKTRFRRNPIGGAGSGIEFWTTPQTEDIASPWIDKRFSR